MATALVLPGIVLFPVTANEVWSHFTNLPPSYSPDKLKWEVYGLIAYAVLTAFSALFAGIRRLMGRPQGWFVRWAAPVTLLPLAPLGTLCALTAWVFGPRTGKAPAWHGASLKREITATILACAVASAWAPVAMMFLPERQNLLDHAPYTIGVAVVLDLVATLLIWRLVKGGMSSHGLSPATPNLVNDGAAP